MHTPKAVRAVLLTLVLALFASACGGDDAGTAAEAAPAMGATDECGSGSITGAGSTFVQSIAQQWIKDFGQRCPDTTVSYQGVGSGAGLEQLTVGTVDFAASDVVMGAEEQADAEATNGPILHIPWAAGGIAVEYNLPDTPDLQLTSEAVAGIFAGTITSWDDEAIAATNPDADLPATPIQVVHRSDGSGSTAAFTAYLTATAPHIWTAGTGKEVPWPTGQGAKGSDGVTSAVQQTVGAISYAELAYPTTAGLSIARLQNSSGRFVGPDAAAVSAAVDSADVPADLKVAMDYTPSDPAAYPISTVTFVVVPERVDDDATAAVLRGFLLFALGDGQDVARDLSFAPLPSSIADEAASLAETISS